MENEVAAYEDWYVTVTVSRGEKKWEYTDRLTHAAAREFFTAKRCVLEDSSCIRFRYMLEDAWGNIRKRIQEIVKVG